MNSRSIQIAAVGFALLAVPALASYMTLDAPDVPMAKDYPKADYAKVKAALTRKDCKFLGGAALNAFTSLRYGGDTTALNKLIGDLSRCSNVTVHVNFFRPTGAADHDWLVTHTAGKNEFVVRINLESENIKLEALYLPPLQAEKPAGD